MKVLILKPSSLGDVVQALPVLRLIKLAHPDSEVHWWIAKDLVPLLSGDSQVHTIIPFERRRWKNLADLRYQWAGIRQMRAQRYDWVIDLQGLMRSGAFAWLAGGACTVGLDAAREGARGFYDVAVPRPAGKPHAVDWYLAVLKEFDVPVDGKFQWLPIHEEARAYVLGQANVRARRWFIINPGARWENKRWPVEYFRRLVQQLAAEFADAHFAILGGREDMALGEAIANGTSERCLNLAGRTTLPEMIEWIRLGEVMVTNDTGPMHVGAALGKPIISLFGPTSPLETGPYGQIERALRISLPCAPCFKGTCGNTAHPLECLRAITPEGVCREVHARLNA